MKRIISLLTVLLCLVVAANIAVGADNKKYDFKSAIIEMVLTNINDMMEMITKTTIFIDDWGKKEARHIHETTKIKLMNQTTETKSISIIEGAWVTNIDLVNKTATRMKIDMMGEMNQMSRSDQEKFAKQFKKGMNATSKEIGEEKIAGMPCKITETTMDMGGMKSITRMWTYKGFVLKNEAEMMGNKIVEVATSVKENAKIPPGTFTVPKDIPVRTIEGGGFLGPAGVLQGHQGSE
jgi:hypothetical protein